jgi:tRNA-specific 2-thiouridylase
MEIIPETNTIVLGEEPDLSRSEMTVGKLNLIKYDKIYEGMEANVKIRYKDKGTLAWLYPQQPATVNSQPSTVNNMVNVRFFEDAKGVAPGQSAVFYEGEDVVGGGLIQRYNPAF